MGRRGKHHPQGSVSRQRWPGGVWPGTGLGGDGGKVGHLRWSQTVLGHRLEALGSGSPRGSGAGARGTKGLFQEAGPSAARLTDEQTQGGLAAARE